MERSKAPAEGACRWEIATRAAALLGETPVWDPLDEVVYWVDILGRAVHRYDPADGSDSSFATPSPVGCVGLSADGLVLALEEGFATCGRDGGQLKIWPPLVRGSRTRFNDGRVDARGRFYAGTMDWQEKEPLGALYMAHADGTIKKVLTSLVVSNGLDFSSDGSLLYHIDSATRGVDVYEVDGDSGGLVGRRSLFQVARELGEPDGLVLDEEGCLWISLWGGGRIIRFDLQGNVLDEVVLPISQPSGLTFGGRGLDQLYVTSARDGLDASELVKQPLAGALFCVSVAVRGRSTNLFR